MKQKLLLKTMLLLCALVVGSGSAWATDVIYSIDGRNTLTTTGTAPNGSTATIAETYTTSKQMTSGNSQTLTLKGYNGYKITALTLSMKSNKSSGAGKLSYSTNAGSSFTYIIGSSSTDSKFSEDWYGSWSQSYVDVTKSNLNIICGESNVIIKIETTANSLYCESYTITYVSSDDSKVGTPSIGGTELFLNSTEVNISCDTDDANIQYSTNDGVTWNNYVNSFIINETTTVKAKATKSGLTDSEVASKTFTKITPMSVAEARAAIDAASGTEGVYVTGIVCEGGSSLSSGALNYWISDDGTETDKFEIYKGKGIGGASFTSTNDVRVGDIVVVTGDIKKYNSTYEFDSNSQLMSIIHKVIAPSFSPVAGAVAAGTTVTISTETDGATIYYTTDGSNPTTESSIYATPIIIDAAKTIKAFAVKDGCPNSDIASASYTIALPVETPTFSVAAGTYYAAQSVTIATETDGATIYYTINGDEPTTASTEYIGAINVNQDMTIKAIAVKDGMANSSVASSEYTIIYVATLPLYFNDGKASLPTGMSGNGLGGDYSSAPKLKFDSTGDELILKINEIPGILSFDIKGNSFSGGTFKVQTSANGVTYTDLASYTALNDLQSENFKNLGADVRYIKWVYTNKSNGNVALGNIKLSKTITLAASGYASYCSPKALDLTPGDGYAAYAVTAISGSTVTFSKITGAVPAETPFILYGEGKGGTTINLSAATGETTAVTGNMLVGTLAPTAITTVSGDYTNFGLSGGSFVKINDGTLPANKAYLPVLTANIPSNAREFTIIFDDMQTTGVNDVRSKMADVRGDFFDLQGRKVANPTKGLYIVNGKKVVIK